ncbi:class I SAM-dependent methyltransferase [Brachybacterium phenoliresistens]|uniref:class I SAM-dependent methyltransferase n=1 Tax=Brachybacterium phenoliresistens TaxID=396014 RepID=UPI000A00423D|nr:class I SAM-dependent methyltransferase [Brachybacterium phenoliresistens]
MTAGQGSAGQGRAGQGTTGPGAPWRGTARAAAAYGARAAEYVQAVGTMEATAPQDRALVERWAAQTAGPLLDLGCGPGQWTAHLAGRGHDVVGMDPAAGFLEIARRAHPAVRFRDGGVEDLDPAEPWGGILAWYSLIHLDPADVPAALARMHACLVPGGRALIGFFAADDSPRAQPERAADRAAKAERVNGGAARPERAADGAAHDPETPGPEPFPHAVATAYRWPAETMADLLQRAGFTLEHSEQRTDPGARPHAAILAVREG